MKKFMSALLGTAMLMLVAVSAQAVPVDLELTLLVDVSGSISTLEYNLQKTGYRNAFYDADVQAAITGGHYKNIAVNYVEWSGSTQQSQRVAFTLIDDATSAESFGSAIFGLTRAFSGSTAPGSALDFATPLFTGNGYEGTRLVIDVSSDGAKNQGTLGTTARDAALAAGVDTINALTIGGSSFVYDYYRDNIIGGTDAFVTHSNNFVDFASAIKAKLIKEINPVVPEPSTWILMGMGLAGLAFYRRKKSA